MSSGGITRAITAPRSTRRWRRSRRTTSHGCAWPGDGLSSIPRCSSRIRSCGRPTTSARRRSWSAACCMRRTESGWSRRSTRRRAGRSGCSRCRRASCPSERANRGVAYWSQGANGRILTFRNQYLYALDARTGKPVAEFGAGGRVDLTAATGAREPYTWNGTPLVVRDVVVLGSSMADQDSAATHERRRRATCTASTCGPGGCGGRSSPIPKARASPASRHGRTSRGATRARRTCGRR